MSLMRRLGILHVDTTKGDGNANIHLSVSSNGNQKSLNWAGSSYMRALDTTCSIFGQVQDCWNVWPIRRCADANRSTQVQPQKELPTFVKALQHPSTHPALLWRNCSHELLSWKYGRYGR
eukprot:2354265-Amphidinium_carterae.2